MHVIDFQLGLTCGAHTYTYTGLQIIHFHSSQHLRFCVLKVLRFLAEANDTFHFHTNGGWRNCGWGTLVSRLEDSPSKNMLLSQILQVSQI